MILRMTARILAVCTLLFHSLHIKQFSNLCTDRPVILEEGKSNIPESELEATVISEPVDAGADPSSFDLNKSVDPSSHKIWWNPEDESYSYDGCPNPPLMHDRLLSTPMLAQDQPYFYQYPPRSSQDEVNLDVSKRTTEGAELALYTLP